MLNIDFYLLVAIFCPFCDLQHGVNEQNLGDSVFLFSQYVFKASSSSDGLITFSRRALNVSDHFTIFPLTPHTLLTTENLCFKQKSNFSEKLLPSNNILPLGFLFLFEICSGCGSDLKGRKSIINCCTAKLKCVYQFLIIFNFLFFYVAIILWYGKLEFQFS